MIFGRKLVCARCGLTIRARDYDLDAHAAHAADARGECSHWFFDSRDTVGLNIGRAYEARRGTEA